MHIKETIRIVLLASMHTAALQALDAVVPKPSGITIHERVAELPPEIQRHIYAYAYVANMALFPDNNWQESCRMHHADWVWSVAVLSDGRIVSGSIDRTVRVWDSETGAESTRMHHDNSVRSVAVLPDGRIVSGSTDGTVRVWDARTGGESARMHHNGSVCSVAVLSDGRIVSGSGDKTVRVWGPTGNELARMNHDGPVCSVAALPDGSILSGSTDGTVRVWNSVTGAELRRMNGVKWVYSLASLSDGRIVSGSDDNTVRVCNSATGVELARMDHDGFVRSVAALSDGRIVSGSGDKTVRVWQESKACVKNYLKKTSLSYDARYLVWLLLEYKAYLQKEHPERKAIRIQDVAAYACARWPHKETTIEQLTDARKSMPPEVQQALVKGLGVYSYPDEKLKEELKKSRYRCAIL